MRKKKIISLLMSCLFMVTMFGGCTKTVIRKEYVEDTSEEEHIVAPYFPDDDEIIYAETEDDRVLTDIEFTMENTVGTDVYGRKVLPYGNAYANRDVGIFFFTWMGMHPEGQTGIYDISKLLLERPDDLWNPQGTKYSPAGKYHLWGEPLYGYYNSLDPWVMDKQVQMLTTMGVDFLGLDATNGVVYSEVYDLLFRTLDKYFQQGFNVPKVMFLINSGSVATTEQIYEEFYKEDCKYGRYPHLWYTYQGKPYISCDLRQFGKDETSQLLQEFFYIEQMQWPNEEMMENAFSWMSFDYPQYNHSGNMNVSIAQHKTVRMSDTQGSWGRGYDVNLGKNVSDRSREGINYASQWQTVLNSVNTEKPVTRAFITGYNEWTALKFPLTGSGSEVYFVDLFNEEFSRDIEPMKGGYQDNFYLQTMAYLRRYKYEKGKHYVLPQKTILTLSDAEQWEGVRKYIDFANDTMERDYAGFHSSVHYTDRTNRNDIVLTQMIHDENYLYIRVQTSQDITAYEQGDKNYMNIWLGNCSGGGYGDYNYVINRFPGSNNVTSIERSKGGFEWEKIGEVECVIEANTMAVKIPLVLIGVDAANPRVRFKVSDNVLNPEDPMSFYVQGDSAPIGRLSYCYGV